MCDKIKKIYVVVTMDCERPTSETHPDASGPPDYVAAEEWTKAYASIAEEHQFPVTFFLHPEVALAQAKLFVDLERAGACLGLHLHPWRFGDGRYRAELGGLSAETARAALSEATALWQQAFGRRPVYFRPGAMSANDSTFKILEELGFRGGSVTLPGRVFPDIHSVWSGAAPDPHRAHRVFRQLEGDLDFADMPFSVDFSTINEKAGRWFHWDLRPDFDCGHQTVAWNIVRQIKARAPAVPVVNTVTHNDHDFGDPQDRVCRNFKAVLKAIENACREEGLRPVGTTIETVCDLVLKIPPQQRELKYASGKVMFKEGRLREDPL